MPFGAFVEILPNQDGLVHISKLSDHRVEKVEDVINLGDTIVVKATEIDKQGRLNLSRQAALDEFAAKGEDAGEEIDPEALKAALAAGPPPPREESSFGSGGNRGGYGGNRDRGPRR